MNLASLIRKGTLRGLATATPATPAKDGAERLRTVATVATVAVAKARELAANDPPEHGGGVYAVDPDRWAWPHSGAMTGAEIDTFTARLAHFTDKGLDLEAGERVADRLVIRDREQDDRRHCLECMHLHRAGGWRCRQWQRAGIGSATVPAELAGLLQRCDAFNPTFTGEYGEGAKNE